MDQYMWLVDNILANGDSVESRAGNCKVLTHQMLTFDLRQGFPRLTERYVPFKSVAVELEGFLGGITSKKWFQDRKCKFWNEWANPETLKQEITDSGNGDLPASEIDDLGPIYGWQWRRFGRPYYKVNDTKLKPSMEYTYSGDQLASVVNRLSVNPSCRRLRVSSVNSTQEHMMALPACHDYWKIEVINRKYLDLAFHMRSWDVYLGAPANIQSYAILAHLLARHANCTARKLTVYASNAHIYENHYTQSKELVRRTSRKLPEIEFSDYGKFWNWTHEDVKCVGYSHSGKLSAEVNV